MSTGQGTLAGRAVGLILRRVKTARKQSKRGVKLVQSVFRRVRQAEKSLFFRLRDSETGRVLLKAAGMARSPRDLRHRTQVAGPYIARLGAHQPPIDPTKGYGLLSPDTLGDFGHVARSLPPALRDQEGGDRCRDDRLRELDARAAAEISHPEAVVPSLPAR